MKLVPLFLMGVMAVALRPSVEAQPLFAADARVLFQGDSITDMARGRTSDPNHILGHSYVFLIAAREGADFPGQNVTFINRGVGGNTLPDMIARWENDTLALKPDIVSILIGVNDVGHALRKNQRVSVADYEKSYDALLARTLETLPRVRLVLCAPFIADGKSTHDRLADWRADIQSLQAVVDRLGEKYHVPVVHLQKVFEAAARKAPMAYWIWDGVHPTYRGQQLLADEWVRTYRAFYGSALRAETASRVSEEPAAEFVLGSPAQRRKVDVGRLPAGTAEQTFGFAVSGETFGVYARALPAGSLTLELGFVETEADGPDQRAFAVAANGVPLDARLDLWKQAQGANRPWVMKTTYEHAGGMLTLLFSGLRGNAILSFARATDERGRVVAFGSAEQWAKPQRLRAEDARSRAYHPVKAGEVKFFNVDHSPLGAWATLVYGMEGSGGVQVARTTDGAGNLMPHFGLVVIARSDAGLAMMPFANPLTVTASRARMIKEGEVTRRLGAATDHWEVGNGVAWTNYSPMWPLKDFAGAPLPEQRRFALPATWMDWELDNRSGKTPLEIIFSLQQPAEPVRSGWGGFEGYLIDGTSAIAVRKGDADLLSAAEVQGDFGVTGARSAFRFRVRPGERRTFTCIVAHFIPGRPSRLAAEPLELMHAALFRGFGDVIAAADQLYPEAVRRSREIDAILDRSGIGPEREFLAAHALHSYLYNTVLWKNDATGLPVFGVEEGECRFINTLDLTVDNLFYELAMHPWTVRNELDTFLANYSFSDLLVRPGGTEHFPGGLGFYHDMGTSLRFADPQKGQAYSALMTQEELQNWLCCAGIYFHSTGDRAWLERHRDVFRQGLESMLRRDDIDPAKRDGITSFQSYLPGPRRRDEITTYDAMDHSLQQPTDSLYISVKSFGTYLVLAEIFDGLQEGGLAGECRTAATRLAAALLAHWDPASRTFPATFDGQTSSKIIPAIEGLIYPYAMGRADLLTPTGPYGDLIQHLKMHLESVLVPGVCLDPATGGWVLSSTSTTTWESKVYLNQFIAENILGVRDGRTGGGVDQAHVAYQVLGASAVGWTCQFTNRDHLAFGCRHYPRGVTSALWWIGNTFKTPTGS